MNKRGAIGWNRRELASGLAGLMLLPATQARGAKSIDQTEFVKLGGIAQWISIKADDLANPVLLIVHGGPGDVQWPQADKYVPWQKFFTVVQWDQRGAGHTYGQSGGDNTPDVNLKRIAADGVELARYLCHRLDKKKIIVLGHSWGSLVGVTMVKAEPDLFGAYVGTGQVTSWAATVQYQFDLLLAKARKEKNEAAIAKLMAVGKPDPANSHQYFAFLNQLNFRALWAPSDQNWIVHLRAQARILTGNKDFEDDEAGQRFSGKSLIGDELAADLPRTATHIDTAFFLIQGADDVITPAKEALDYFNKVKAPYKKLVLLPDAGHFAFMTSGGAFLAALTNKVRFVAIARGA
jgi:pimeloyl-ACP methyl ester carboxylesterase